jgi:methyl-accepting chemotaxis protein
VEAARAGGAGMGFAVVANEVRNLAQRCTTAAKETAGLIEDSINKSRDSVQRVDEIADAIRLLTSESLKIEQLVETVNSASREQARGVDQIGQALGHIEQVTQKTAAHSEESAAAAEELNTQASALAGITLRLGTMIGSR